MTKNQTLAVLGMTLFFIVFSTISMLNLSLTTDEGMHYTYGTNILNLNSDRLRYSSGIVDDSKMPITALNALPAKLAKIMPIKHLKIILALFSTARFVTIMISALVALLVFHWSHSLYGFVPGLISLGLYIFDPNIIAHSQLVTTDLYCVSAVLFCSWCLWKFAHHRTVTNGLILAFGLALGQLTKYTALALYPLSMIALVLYDLPVLAEAFKRRAMPVLGNYLIKYTVYTVVTVLISILVINVGYLFNRTFTRLSNYEFGSNTFKTIQAIPVISKVPVPTPYPYLQGLDQMLVTNSTGVRYGGVYLMGQLHSNGKGFPGYYFVASLLKVPIAIQVVLIGAILVYLFDRKRRESFLANEVFLFVPVIFYTIYFNFMLNPQIGIRYYLVVFPLLYVFIGNLFRNWACFSSIQRMASFGLAGYLIISLLSYYPHYLSYFNELVWNRTMAYKYLVNSNLDWGQNKNYLHQYMKTHPGTIFEPSKIVSGQIIVSANDLVGIDDPLRFSWLRENFNPTGTVAYSYLIYDVSQQDLERLCEVRKICQ